MICPVQVERWLGYIPLVDLEAAKLFEVALDMTDEGNIHDDSTDEHDQRQRKHKHGEHHGPQRDLLVDEVVARANNMVPVKERRV